MQAIYRPILKQALKITWKFKYLWFFGLFAALFGNGGVFNLILNNIQIVENQGVFLQGLRELGNSFSWSNASANLSSVFLSFDFLGTLIFVVFLVLIAFFIWLSIVSQGAVVFGISRAMKSDDKLFAKAFRKGSVKFWPVFLLNILMKIVLFIIILIIGLPFIIVYLKGAESMVVQSFYIILAFIVLVPLAAILSFLIKYAVIYVVNEDNHVGLALKNAWNLFSKNWIVSIEMAAVLFLINVLTSFLLVVVIVFIALPFIMLGMLASYLASSAFFWLVVTLGILTFIAVLFWYGALLNVWQMSNWIILFEKISYNKVYSKILRLGTALTSRKKE
ncbi:MAG: hypothetical protein ABIJ91_04760 [Candidatus Kuenenbacteria bacterium]